MDSEKAATLIQRWWQTRPPCWWCKLKKPLKDGYMCWRCWHIDRYWDIIVENE